MPGKKFKMIPVTEDVFEELRKMKFFEHKTYEEIIKELLEGKKKKRTLFEVIKL